MFIDKCTLQGSEKPGHSNLKLKLNIELNIKKIKVNIYFFTEAASSISIVKTLICVHEL